MIELTQEQWQAITQEENPTVIEPESKTPYIVLRKDLFERLTKLVGNDTISAALLDEIVERGAIDLTEAEKAFSLRIIWMRRMGLDNDEIAESLRDDPPHSAEQERKELPALERLKSRPSSEVLRKLAIKY